MNYTDFGKYFLSNVSPNLISDNNLDNRASFTCVHKFWISCYTIKFNLVKHLSHVLRSGSKTLILKLCFKFPIVELNDRSSKEAVTRCRFGSSSVYINSLATIGGLLSRALTCVRDRCPRACS